MRFDSSTRVFHGQSSQPLTVTSFPASVDGSFVSRGSFWDSVFLYPQYKKWFVLLCDGLFVLCSFIGNVVEFTNKRKLWRLHRQHPETIKLTAVLNFWMAIELVSFVAMVRILTSFYRLNNALEDTKAKVLLFLSPARARAWWQLEAVAR